MSIVLNHSSTQSHFTAIDMTRKAQQSQWKSMAAISNTHRYSCIYTRHIYTCCCIRHGTGQGAWCVGYSCIKSHPLEAFGYSTVLVIPSKACLLLHYVVIHSPNCETKLTSQDLKW